MNNKGFTMIEILGVVVILSIIVIVGMKVVNGTLALGEEQAYDLMKKNIISSANTYILECSSNIIDCEGEYNWNDNEINTIKISVNNLIKHGYFSYDSMVNPMTGKNISDCLIVKAKKNKYEVITITLDESNC